jgi:hypothetical protein
MFRNRELNFIQLIVKNKYKKKRKMRKEVHRILFDHSLDKRKEISTRIEYFFYSEVRRVVRRFVVVSS